MSNAVIKALGVGAVMMGVEMGVSSVNGVADNTMAQVQGAGAVALSTYLADMGLARSGVAIRALTVGALTAGAEYGLSRQTEALWIFALAGAGSYLIADSVAALAYSVQSGSERPGSMTDQIDPMKFVQSAVEVGF